MSNELDAVLDSTLDDLEDLPEFKPFPAGAHRCLATFEKVAGLIGGHPAIELKLKLIETIELANSQDVAPKEGDEAGSVFMMDNKFGVGNFKRIASIFGEALNLNNNGEIVDQVTDIEVVIMSTIKIDKKDSSKTYLNINELNIV